MPLALGPWQTWVFRLTIQGTCMLLNCRPSCSFCRLGARLAAGLLCLVCVSVACRLEHAGAHTLIVNPVGHRCNHVRQQCCRSMDELAELVHLQYNTSSLKAWLKSLARPLGGEKSRTAFTLGAGTVSLCWLYQYLMSQCCVLLHACVLRSIHEATMLCSYLVCVVWAPASRLE